ncbi:MAG: AAA family ATPase [Flammeovirgaceae bacterium]
MKNKTLDKKSETLLFIDEIQEVPEAINTLRYFYEQEPTIPVIAAGSMLESLFDKTVGFPVGRVD